MKKRISKSALESAMKSVKKINALEEKLAKKYYGVSYKELDYDDKDFITCEAYDLLNGEDC